MKYKWCGGAVLAVSLSLVLQPPIGAAEGAGGFSPLVAGIDAGAFTPGSSRTEANRALVPDSAAQSRAQTGTAATTPSGGAIPTPAASQQTTLQSIRLQIDRGHADDALKQISALRATTGDFPGLSRTEGVADYTLGNLKSADTAFAAALKLDPTDQESTQMRGLTLFRLGRPADAIPLLESAGGTVASGGASVGKADPNYLLALCYMDTRRYDDARHAFAAQFGFPPEGAQAYLLTSRMLLRREFLPVSQTFAEKALELEPNLPLAHELLGEIALAHNLLAEAIAEFKKEQAHNPLEPSIYDRLGDTYTRAGDYENAQKSLQEAVLLEPNSTGPYILLGKTLLEKNDPLGAATYLEHAVQMDPSNYISHNLLGRAYRLMGRREDATREIETSQKLQKSDEPKIENLH